MAGGVQGQHAGGAGRKRRRAEGDVQRSVRVSGLGVVVVRVHAGVLRLRDVRRRYRSGGGGSILYPSCLP